jgi:hypothetical protein
MGSETIERFAAPRSASIALGRPFLAHTGRHRVGLDDVLDRVAPVVEIGGFEGARGAKGALTGRGPEREVSHARQPLEAYTTTRLPARRRDDRPN